MSGYSRRSKLKYRPNPPPNGSTHFFGFLGTYCFKNSDIFDLFPKANDARIADAILELFRRRENIDIFNKKALYIYIKEITDATTPQITKIIKRLDTLRVRLFNEYYEHGYIRSK